MIYLFLCRRIFLTSEAAFMSWLLKLFKAIVDIKNSIQVSKYSHLNLIIWFELRLLSPARVDIYFTWLLKNLSNWLIPLKKSSKFRNPGHPNQINYIKILFLISLWWYFSGFMGKAHSLVSQRLITGRISHF